MFYISCLTSKKENRWITSIEHNEERNTLVPSFEEYTDPLAFNAREGSIVCKRLNDQGWIPIMVKADTYFRGSERYKNIPVKETYYY